MDNIKKNFNEIFEVLLESGKNPTAISTALGYTSTSQLKRALDGIPSARAIAAMIANLHVNPTYLFLGKGNMFFKDETEEERLAKKNAELIHQLNDLEELIHKKNDEIAKLKESREELFEIAVRSMRAQKTEESNDKSTPQNPPPPE